MKITDFLEEKNGEIKLKEIPLSDIKKMNQIVYLYNREKIAKKDSLIKILDGEICYGLKNKYAILEKDAKILSDIHRSYSTVANILNGKSGYKEKLDAECLLIEQIGIENTAKGFLSGQEVLHKETCLTWNDEFEKARQLLRIPFNEMKQKKEGHLEDVDE